MAFNAYEFVTLLFGNIIKFQFKTNEISLDLKMPSIYPHEFFPNIRQNPIEKCIRANYTNALDGLTKWERKSVRQTYFRTIIWFSIIEFKATLIGFHMKWCYFLGCLCLYVPVCVLFFSSKYKRRHIPSFVQHCIDVDTLMSTCVHWNTVHFVYFNYYYRLRIFLEEIFRIPLLSLQKN